MTGADLKAFVTESGAETLKVVVYDEHGELKCADTFAVRGIIDGKGDEHIVIGIT